MPKHKAVHGHGTQKHNLPINQCFGCGPDNPDGMHLRFVYDEPARRVRCKFRLSHRYWGPPKHAHGGIIATILDEAMGKVNKFRQVIAVTSEMTVNYSEADAAREVADRRRLGRKGRGSRTL